MELNVSRKLTILELKEEYVNKAKDAAIKPANIRFFYGGRELVEDTLLGEYSIQSEHVIQMFIRG